MSPVTVKVDWGRTANSDADRWCVMCSVQIALDKTGRPEGCWSVMTMMMMLCLVFQFGEHIVGVVERKVRIDVGHIIHPHCNLLTVSRYLGRYVEPECSTGKEPPVVRGFVGPMPW